MKKRPKKLTPLRKLSYENARLKIELKTLRSEVRRLKEPRITTEDTGLPALRWVPAVQPGDSVKLQQLFLRTTLKDGSKYMQMQVWKDVQIEDET